MAQFAAPGPFPPLSGQLIPAGTNLPALLQPAGLPASIVPPAMATAPSVAPGPVRPTINVPSGGFGQPALAGPGAVAPGVPPTASERAAIDAGKARVEAAKETLKKTTVQGPPQAGAGPGKIRRAVGATGRALGAAGRVAGPAAAALGIKETAEAAGGFGTSIGTGDPELAAAVEENFWSILTLGGVDQALEFLEWADSNIEETEFGSAAKDAAGKILNFFGDVAVSGGPGVGIPRAIGNRIAKMFGVEDLFGPSVDPAGGLGEAVDVRRMAEAGGVSIFDAVGVPPEAVPTPTGAGALPPELMAALAAAAQPQTPTAPGPRRIGSMTPFSLDLPELPAFGGSLAELEQFAPSGTTPFSRNQFILSSLGQGVNTSADLGSVLLGMGLNALGAGAQFEQSQEEAGLRRAEFLLGLRQAQGDETQQQFQNALSLAQAEAGAAQTAAAQMRPFALSGGNVFPSQAEPGGPINMDFQPTPQRAGSSTMDLRQMFLPAIAAQARTNPEIGLQALLSSPEGIQFVTQAAEQLGVPVQLLTDPSNATGLAQILALAQQNPALSNQINSAAENAALMAVLGVRNPSL